MTITKAEMERVDEIDCFGMSLIKTCFSMLDSS